MKIKDVCRCCLSNFCFKDMCNEYQFGGVMETYREMLAATFDIILVEHISCRQLICEDCVVKLREASAFKSQVMQAEETISNQLFSILKTGDRATDTRHKSASPGRYDDGYCDFDDTISSDIDNWDPKPDTKGDHGQPLSCVKLEPSEESELKKPFTPPKSDIRKSVIKRTVKSQLSNNSRAKTKPSKKTKHPVTKHKLELERDRENTLSLILNSNMCLFISLKTKYRCYFCTQSFFTIQDLREHSKTHSDAKDVELRFKRLTGLSFKNVDISNLECKLCSESCDDLNVLGTHLKDKHSVPFRNSNHFLIPYKLESGFQCLMCSEKFKTYLRLSIHMNTHFTNHVCDICGVSFINRLSLRTHIHAVHTIKACSICLATFRTVSSKAQHMRKTHNHNNSKRYCLECGKTFPYTYLLEQHKIKDHGAEKQVSFCSQCGKSFLSQNNLKIHIRSVHLQERNYACSICEMRFFTSSDKRRHEKTHEDTKSFSCHYCEGKFKSKDSLRRHLKRQHGNLVTGK